MSGTGGEAIRTSTTTNGDTPSITVDDLGLSAVTYKVFEFHLKMDKIALQILMMKLRIEMIFFIRLHV